MRAEATRRDWRLAAALLAEQGYREESSAIHAALRNDASDPVELEIGTNADSAVARALLTVHRQTAQQEPILGAATTIATEHPTQCPGCASHPTGCNECRTAAAEHTIDLLRENIQQTAAICDGLHQALREMADAAGRQRGALAAIAVEVERSESNVARRVWCIANMGLLPAQETANALR